MEGRNKNKKTGAAFYLFRYLSKFVNTSLHGTWRTLCMNKHLINKAVGRTQKTSFPLSSNSKASLCSDFKTNPNSCEQIQAINICHFTAKALAIHHGMEQREWHVENITWQLGDSLHRNLANGNCPWLGEAGNSNEYNVCKTDSPYFLASLPSLALCFQPRSRPFVWLFARTWIRKNTDCFAAVTRLCCSNET